MNEPIRIQPGSDAEARLWQTTAEVARDASGRVTSAMDREQVKPGATRGSTASTYDSLGRIVSNTEAASSTPDVASITELHYDALDRVTVLEVGAGSPASMRTDYSYDRAGRETKADDGFACRQVGYDYRDLPVSLTEGLVGGTCAAGSDTVEITQTHDGLARMTRSEIVGPAGRPDIGNRTLDDKLDAAGNIRSSSTREAGVASTDSFVLNVLDEVVVETRQDGSTAKSRYDADGNETDRCFWQQGAAVGECLSVGTSPWPNAPTRSTTSAYDALMQRISLIDGSASSTTIYDPDHNYATKASYLPTAGGREQQALYAYDERHRLASITHQLCTISSGHSCSAVTALGSATYEYDDNDNVTRVVESNGAATSDYRYCYDARNQLRYRNTSAACSSSSNDQSMGYDDAGNRLSYNARTFTYDSKGRLEACQNGGCGTVAHDTDGRISQLGSWYFAYDAEGRLIRSCKASGCPSSADKVWFTYDGEGRRTRVKSRTAAGTVVTRDLAYQGDAIIEERLTDGTHTDAVVRRYVVDEAGIVVKMEIPPSEPNGGTYTVTWNGHGDAQALWRLNAEGSVTLANSFTYDTWGVPTTSVHNGVGDVGLRYLYGGRYGAQWDDTFGMALVFMQSRHYKPALGRFLQPDPSGAEMNWYAYTRNNPVSVVDPDGTFAGTYNKDGGGYRHGRRCRDWRWSVRQVVACRHINAVSRATRRNDYWGAADLVSMIIFPIRGLASRLGVSALRSYGSSRVASMIRYVSQRTGLRTRGMEIRLGSQYRRIAPFFKLRASTWKRMLPHYHRRITDSSGRTVPGGSHDWHRPWEKL